MQALREIRSCTVVLPMADIDTDQIFPGSFLTTTSRDGLGQHLFHGWRFRADGVPEGDFPLNEPGAADCRILVAGRNFGGGSSREHAVWALLDYGFQAVISTAFADIFKSNALKNGLLPIEIGEPAHRWLTGHPHANVAIDVAASSLTLPNGDAVSYAIDPFARHCLLEGIDPLGFLRQQEESIAEFERRQNA